jgi:hypothetical protein
MWICAKIGFYSIVKKGTPETWQIRARVSQDLKNLVAAAQIGVPLIETPKGDYKWRIVVNAPQLARVFEILAASIDYPNFKDQVAETPDQQAKLDAYHRFWGDMLRVQSKQRPQ